MAGQADGSIYVNTELDPQGFKAGSERMKGAIKSLSAQVKQLGPSLKQAVKGNVDALQSFKGKSDEVRASIAEIEAEMEALGHKPVATDQYADLSKSLDEAVGRLQVLEHKQNEMKAQGVSQSSTRWQSLQAQIEEARRKVDTYYAACQELQDSGQAFIPGTSTDTYAQLASQLEAAKAQFAEMQSAAQRANSSLTQTPTLTGYIKSAFQAVGGAIRNAFNGIRTVITNPLQSADRLLGTMIQKTGQLVSATARFTVNKLVSGLKTAAKTAGGALLNGLKAAVSATKKLVVGNNSYKKSFGGMASTIKQVGLGLLGVRGVYSLLRKAVSAYMSANTNLANQLSSCWTSLGNILGPIITRVINLVSTAISYVTALLKLFGLTSSAAASTAEAAGSAGGAAEKAQKSLTGFDEINALQDNSSGGGGGGGGGGSIGSELPDVTLPDWVELMVEQLKAGDWAMAATTLTNRLNAMVASVDWAGIGDKIGYYLNGALTFLAAAIMTFDWEALGADLGTCLEHVITNVNWRSLGVILTAKFAIILQTLTGFFGSLNGESISTALTDFMYGTVNAADWVGIATSLSQNISRFVSEIDFTALAQALSAQIRTALQSMIAAVDNFDWVMLGQKVAGFINGIDWGGVFTDLAQLLSGFLISALTGLSTAIKEVDWQSIGNEAATALANVDWAALVTAISDGIGAALGGLAALLWGLIEDAWNDVVEWWYDVAYDDGGFCLEGLLQGIGDALTNIGTWIKENIFQPFINGFKEAFGINSPSTVMAEQGGFITEGLLQGITDAWGSITDWFSEALSSIGDSISETWDDVVTWTENAWSDVSSAISDTWSDVKSTVSAGYEKVKSGVSSAWTTISSKTSSAWSNVKSSLSTSWTNIKSAASSGYGAVKTGVTNAWTNIKSNTSTAWGNVKSSLSTAWSGIKSTAASGYDTVKSGVASAWLSTQTDTTGTWANIKLALSTAWSGIKSAASDGYNAVKNGVTSAWESIKSSTASAWSNIKSTIQNQGWSSLGSNITSGIKSGIANGWSTLTSYVKQKATSLLTTAKSALGIHSPSRLFRDEVGLNIGLGIGEGLEDSESAVLKSVTGVADAIAAEFNAGEYSVKSIVPTAEIDGAITSFTDSITDSFTALMEKLDAIAKRVTFSVPAFAGSVVPYQVSASGSRNDASGVDSEDGKLVRLMESVSNRQNALLREQNNLLRQLLEKDTVVSAVIGTGDLVNGLSRKNRRDGKTVVPVGT